MSNEELKEIVEGVTGSTDPFRNVSISNIVKKIVDLPENTEVSIYELADNNLKSSTDIMFELNDIVPRVCEKIGIVLDYGKFDGQCVGLPFRIPFVKRYCQKAKSK